MIKILLDAGHGAGKDHNRGALCFNEGDNNFVFSAVLKTELEKYDGVKVDLIRNKISDNPTIYQRSTMGLGYDLFLSLHSNASNGMARGTEVWDSVEKPNKKLAQAIVDVTSKLFIHPNRGVKYKAGQPGYNWYGVLRFNQAKSSMIIESGFHDNNLDCNYFKNNHQKIAEAQANEIAKYYGLKKKGSVVNMAMPNQPINNQPSDWAKVSWLWTTKEGFLDGTRPKDPVTREEMSAILHRLYLKGLMK